ncbi:MAG: aldo/keto reductase [Alphaproteobacteria bacterium]|jgi:L-galactose dehydrogenase/L-glyceraldehyde 3-phosphate reductase|nr:aldo/keto reductase [Alphaproteobacteria bacterium]
MKYRPFGKTGFEVSEIVFGAGFVGGILLGDDDEVKRKANRRAHDGGVNWNDTAPTYGDGRTEAAHGWLLPEIDDTPYLSTKFRIEPDGPGDIPGQIRRSLEASLGRLNRDRVDLLQLHNQIGPETGEGRLGLAEVLKSGGVADGLDALRQEGLCDFVGFTALGDTQALRQVIASGRFDSAQVYYNLLEPSADRPVPAGWSGHDFGCLMDDCAEAGLAVMAIRIMAAGVIATDLRHGREIPMFEAADVASEENRARQALAALGDFAGARAQAAVRFVLDNPKVSCALLGAAELDHIDQALGAVDLAPLGEATVARLERLYETDFGRL